MRIICTSHIKQVLKMVGFHFFLWWNKWMACSNFNFSWRNRIYWMDLVWFSLKKINDHNTRNGLSGENKVNAQNLIKICKQPNHFQPSILFRNKIRRNVNVTARKRSGKKNKLQVKTVKISRCCISHFYTSYQLFIFYLDPRFVFHTFSVSEIIISWKMTMDIFAE